MNTDTTEIIHKIDDLRKDMDANFAALPNLYATKDGLASVTEQVSKKIDMTWFIGVIITILSLQAGVFYLMFAKIENIEQNTQSTKESVANIEGKLEPFDFILEK